MMVALSCWWRSTMLRKDSERSTDVDSSADSTVVAFVAGAVSLTTDADDVTVGAGAGSAGTCGAGSGSGSAGAGSAAGTGLGGGVCTPAAPAAAA